jgi:hypothetical protein
MASILICWPFGPVASASVDPGDCPDVNVRKVRCRWGESEFNSYVEEEKRNRREEKQKRRETEEKRNRREEKQKRRETEEKRNRREENKMKKETL